MFTASRPARTRLPLAAGLAAFAAFAVAGCSSSKPISVGASSPPIPYAAGPIVSGHREPLGAKNPYYGNPVAISGGRRLFVWFNCAACHGGHGGGGMGPSLRDAKWRFGGSDAQIFNSIAEGRPKGMPAWGTKIPQTQIWQLVAYIQSMRMRRPLEADPPTEPADERVGPPSKEEPSGVPMVKYAK